jgi:NarL family two-component system response regulator LiaR
MQNPITILIVDDHAVVRQGVRAFLDTQPDLKVVGGSSLPSNVFPMLF